MQFAKRLFESSKGTVNYDRLSVGILVGGVKSMELSNSDCQTISIARGVPVDDVPHIGWCSRTLWKPEHSFEGLRYRVGTHVIFADPDKGDTVAVLESLFSVKIDSLFFSAKENILNMMEKQTLAISESAQQITQSYLKLHFLAER